MTIPPGIVLPASLLLGWGLLVLGLIDAQVFRLPDAITYPLAIAGLACAWLLDDFIDHAIGLIAGFAALAAVAWAYERLRGREGLGLGDAKLGAVAGAWLGWMALPSVVLLGALGGLAVYAVAAIRRGREALAEPIPFGVPLAFAIWLIWLYGPLV
jgi:leader peptidase (prepilin peptidase)/N-methyltransferase